MPQSGRRRQAFALAITALLAYPVAASAHDKRNVGLVRLTIGWGDEPALSGFKNSVDVDVSDAAGAPVTEPGAVLAVEVSFGDERRVLPLVAVAERPGKFRAWIVPTRQGTYTFHITGKVKNQTIDITSTCSDKTFDCVTDVSEVQFPAKDPSAGQLAERISRTFPRAERAMDTATGARTVAIVAIAVAVLALGTAIRVGVRKGTTGH